MSTYDNLLRPIIAAAISEGRTIGDTAKAIGIHAATLSKSAKRMGFKWPDHRGRPSIDIDRLKQITARLDAGETLQSIGDDLGITRERVRQIAKKGGHTTQTQRKRAQQAMLTQEVAARAHLQPKVIAHQLGIDSSVVNTIARKSGIKLAKRDPETNAKLAALAEKVSAGQSFRAAAGNDAALAAKLSHYCREHGIESQAPSRWSVGVNRAAIIRRGIEANQTWAQIAREVAQDEAVRKIVPAALYNWTKNHHPEILNCRPARVVPPKPERQKRQVIEKPVRIPRPAVEIEVADSVKETALAYRGKASASQIAAACGVSRNSIIGHWHRAGVSMAA